MSLIKRNKIKSFQVDNTTIISRYDIKNDSYDVVEGCFNGFHGKVMNKVSTKSYYIISGEGVFNIDDTVYNIEVGDIITVESKQWLSIQGRNLKTLIITTPPFNSSDEEWK